MTANSNDYVYTTAYGEKFHTEYCNTITASKKKMKVSITEALKNKKLPCKICMQGKKIDEQNIQKLNKNANSNNNRQKFKPLSNNNIQNKREIKSSANLKKNSLILNSADETKSNPIHPINPEDINVLINNKIEIEENYQKLKIIYYENDNYKFFKGEENVNFMEKKNSNSVPLIGFCNNYENLKLNSKFIYFYKIFVCDSNIRFGYTFRKVNSDSFEDAFFMGGSSCIDSEDKYEVLETQTYLFQFEDPNSVISISLDLNNNEIFFFPHVNYNNKIKLNIQIYKNFSYIITPIITLLKQDQRFAF